MGAFIWSGTERARCFSYQQDLPDGYLHFKNEIFYLSRKAETMKVSDIMTEICTDKEISLMKVVNN
jgi:hypothetical protein